MPSGYRSQIGLVCTREVLPLGKPFAFSKNWPALVISPPLSRPEVSQCP